MKLFPKIMAFVLMAMSLSLSCFEKGNGDSSDPSKRITISDPDNNETLSGVVTVRGDSSSLDSLAVTVDNDPAGTVVITLSGYGNWETDIDTARFIDGDHVIVAYDPDDVNVQDQVLVSTDNGNGEGNTVTVPVSLSNGIYDEVSSYKPLYVYLESRANGQVYGRRFTAGSLIFDDSNIYDIEHVPNGLYEVSAFLDRNDNMHCDEGIDFFGTASLDLNVSNLDCTSANVVLSIYDGTDNESGTSEEDLLDPSASGSISISNPNGGPVLSDTIDVNGQVDSGIDYVAVEIDNNSYTRRVLEVSTVMPRVYDWETEFNTLLLQDGLHIIKAYVNDHIFDVESFVSDNGNDSGYFISIPVETADSFSGEISEFTPLYVYAKMPATGSMILAKYVSGDLPGNFELGNVPNGDYFIGVFLDKNDNLLIDRGDCTGVAETMYRVWYSSGESSSVILHGTEVEITVPDDEGGIPDIPAGEGYFIHAEGHYRFTPDEITVYMRKGAMTYSEVETSATVNSADPATHLGTWEADLDISEVFGRGWMWLNVKSRYGARYEYDSVLVNLESAGEREIHIALPEDGSRIFSDTLSMKGIYTDDPDSVSVFVEYSDSGLPQSVAIGGEGIVCANGEWSADFSGLALMNIDDDELTIRARAQYSGLYISEDTVTVTFDYRIDTGLEIISPGEGENVGVESVTASGTYEGSPDNITVEIETGSGTKPASGVSYSGGSWSATIDLDGVEEGTRMISATADYGYWGSAEDEVSVDVGINVEIPGFTFRYEVISDDFDSAEDVMYYIGYDDLVQHSYGAALTNDYETSWSYSGTDDASAYWFYTPTTYYCQVGVSVVLSYETGVTGHSTINMYFNNQLEYTATLEEAGYNSVQGYIEWQEGSDTLIFHDGAWW